MASIVSLVALGALAVERGIPWRSPDVDVDEVSRWLTTYRRTWYALPLVALTYTALGLVMVPVLALIAATGIAFGPWLGPPYAMVACLTSASVGFGLGRWAGATRVESIGGPRVRRLTRALERNGTLAVFFLRKVPAPFMLANVVAGASGVRYRDFVVGTILGMGAFVVALAGFGYQIRQAIREPSASVLLTAIAFLSVPFAVAWAINRRVSRKLEDGSQK